MNWIEIASYKKEIPANKTLLISFGEEEWAKGELKRIEFDKGTKKFVFEIAGKECTDATHFMIIEKPKPKTKE